MTRLLQSIGSDDARAAQELLPAVYDELRKLAAYKMAREGQEQTLQPTALVHEAWMRLVGGNDRTFENRTHFFNAAGEAMRRILIDRARRRQSIRHGAGQQPLNLEDCEIAVPENDQRLLAVHDALNQLENEDPLKGNVVKLRYFVGLTDAETAKALGLSIRTVERYWAYSKVWLFTQIGQ